MASTYKVSDAIAIVSSTAATKGAENIHTAADLAMSYLWNAYDWRQSLEDLQPFYLIPGERDYYNFGAETNVVPADFGGLKHAWIEHATLDGNGSVREEMTVKKDIPFHEWGGTIWPAEVISYQPSIPGFRLSSFTPTSIGSPYWWIGGIYKTRPTKVTGALATSTTIPWDDVFFPMYVEALRWKLWQLNGDPRAGTVQVYPTGSRVFSGQAGIVHDLIQQAVQAESNDLGPEQIYPDCSLTDY